MPDNNEHPYVVPPPAPGPTGFHAPPPPGVPVGAFAEPLPKRPSAPFGIGLTLIIGGGLMLLLDLVGFAMLLWAQSSTARGLGIPMPQTMMVQYILPLVQAILSIVAIVAGIGLIGYRAWARQLSIGWAAVALVEIVLAAVVNFVWVLPATQRLTQNANLPEASAQSTHVMAAFGAAMSVLWTVILAVLPVLTLILMTRPSAKESCT